MISNNTAGNLYAADSVDAAKVEALRRIAPYLRLLRSALARMILTCLLAAATFTGIAGSAKASLPPGYYDLGGGQGVLVLRSSTASAFGQNTERAATIIGLITSIVGPNRAKLIATLSVTFYYLVEAWRIEDCANRYGAPYVYIYTIWGGLPIWADPAW